jgi:hypothetical protein
MGERRRRGRGSKEERRGSGEEEEEGERSIININAGVFYYAVYLSTLALTTLSHTAIVN